MTKAIVGIDIGGTKSQIRVITRDGKITDRQLPTEDWRVPGWRHDPSALIARIEDCLGSDELEALAVGAHGCDSTEECKEVELGLNKRLSTPVIVVNDAELLPPAAGLPGAMAMIVGTGSIVVTRDAKGDMLVAGGWGWLLGDEGSASGLVREAGVRIAQHLDRGGDPEELLTASLCRSLSLHDPARLGSALAELGSAAALGRHAPLVFDAYRAKSPLAIDVLDAAARALVELVDCLIERGADARQVVLGGGIVANEPILFELVSKALADRFGGRVAAVPFRGEPVLGACRLAAGLVDPPYSPSLFGAPQ